MKLPEGRPSGRLKSRHANGGFTLVELMIAMLLGLIVVGAAIAIFISNRQTYVATESLGRVQESVRVAFELMARDLREAGGNPCDNGMPVANIVNGHAANWVTDWAQAVRGFEGSVGFPGAPAGWVSGTDAIELKSAYAGVSISSHVPSSWEFVVDSADHGFAAGDLALVCDFTQGTVFQISAVSGATIRHEQGATPGNCTSELGLPECSGSTYIFPKNSMLARVNATRWFVGENDRGGTSLFRVALRSGAAAAGIEEVVEGVTDMQLEYLLPTSIDYQPANAIAPTQLAEINAVRVTLQFQGQENVGPGGARVERQLAYVASLRNRNP